MVSYGDFHNYPFWLCAMASSALLERKVMQKNLNTIESMPEPDVRHGATTSFSRFLIFLADFNGLHIICTFAMAIVNESLATSHAGHRFSWT